MQMRHVYVPIIKGKLNDLKALSKLTVDVRSLVKPLIEVMPVNRKKETVDEHLQKFVGYIAKHCPSGDIFVDFHGFMPEEKLSSGANATVGGFALLAQFGRSVTPTYGFDRNDALWYDLRKIVTDFNQGFCFRVSIDDLDDRAEETWVQIIERTTDLGLTASQIDLILDLRHLGNRLEHELKETVVDFLSLNSKVSEYRSLIVAGSSALKTVADANIKHDSVGEIVRAELGLWANLRRDTAESINPIFGDYGVIHPDFSNLSGRNKYMNAKIRYTVGDRIIYYRGHGLLYPVKDYGQYHDLAARACRDRRYRGANHSFGDSYLSQCANRTISHGAPGNWVLADMNHHITYTARQIERLMKELAEERSESEAREAVAVI